MCMCVYLHRVFSEIVQVLRTIGGLASPVESHVEGIVFSGQASSLQLHSWIKLNCNFKAHSKTISAVTCREKSY